MVRLRNLLWMSLIAVFIVSMVIVLPTSASPTTLYVWSDIDLIDPDLVEGTTFSVDVTLDWADDLNGFEFKLGYDPTVLNATAITIGEFGSLFPVPLAQAIYRDEGYVHCARSVEIAAPEPVSGGGILATIDFTVVGEGASVLDLYETGLVDSSGYPIYYEVIDGYFSNIGLAPVAAFTFEPELPEKDETVTFDASDSYDPDGTIVSYFWDFGDGTSDTGKIVYHAYGELGIYTITLTVIDNAGITSQASDTIEVTPPKIAKADLAEWGARPEHRRFRQSMELALGEDLNNAFYAEVQSLAYNPVMAKVRFTVYGPTKTTSFETTTCTLENYLDIHIFDTSTDVTAGPEFDTTRETGRHYVEAQCFYYDPVLNDWVGGKKKLFSFNVVP